MTTKTPTKTESGAAHRSRATEWGLSLLEVLIAAALLLVIALATIPLFLSATQNNLSGSESSQLSSFVSFEAERAYQLGFQHPSLALPAGATSVQSAEVWSAGDSGILGDESWSAGTPASTSRWWRDVEVRQYSVTDIEDDELFNTPLDGNTQPIFVHLKELEMAAGGARGGSAEGRGRRVRVRLLMAF